MCDDNQDVHKNGNGDESDSDDFDENNFHSEVNEDDSEDQEHYMVYQEENNGIEKIFICLKYQSSTMQVMLNTKKILKMVGNRLKKIQSHLVDHLSVSQDYS